MTVKEAIDILERSCGFHYNATDKCYGCLFENSVWCGDDFHESLLAMLKELQAEIEQLRNDANARRCKDCKHFDYRRLYKCRIHGSLFQPKDGDWFCADFDPSDGAVLEAFAEDG